MGDWRGNGFLGRFGHADRRALIDLKSLYYLAVIVRAGHQSQAVGSSRQDCRRDS
jgi:hypothetical protein